MGDSDDINSSLNTRDRLIQTGIRLFSKYGYEGTTMRMIEKDANANISAVSFHFGNKQNFYKAVLEFVVEDADPFYFDSFYKEYAAVKEKGIIDKDKAMDLIERLLSVQLHVAIDQPRPEYIALANWEQKQPPEGSSPITEKVQTRIEDSLAYLLTCYETSLDYRKAILISRFINGGIITFSEHPAFMEMIRNRINLSPSDDYIKSTLKQFILNSIEHCCRF